MVALIRRSISPGVDDGDHPLAPWLGARRVLELEEMLDDALELAFHRPLLLAAQVLHLLGQMQQVERTVPALIGEAAQRRRLVARPGVEILLVKLLGPRRHCLAPVGS
jgi:hypothetical protein